MPAELVPPEDQQRAFVLFARGVQSYECVEAAWKLVAPEAELFEADEHAGSHGAGPTWIATDGSSVVGEKRASVNVDATAIPWLLVEAVRHNAKTGRFSTITWIQRRDTTGGLAPTTGCDASKAGVKIDVEYTARYVFFRAR